MNKYMVLMLVAALWCVCCVVEAKESGGVQLWENGPYWAECNVGAVNPEEYGYYFWWGDTVGYVGERGTWMDWYYSDVIWVSSKGSRMSNSPFDSSRCPTEKPKQMLLSRGYIDPAGNLVAKYDAATVHLGAPWRMPTAEEFDALIDNCTTTWVDRNGVSGHLVTGKGAFSSKSIFLPAAGRCDNFNLRTPGTHGHYRSSTASSMAWFLDFGQYRPRLIDFCYPSYCGMSVRPVRDPVLPEVKLQLVKDETKSWMYKVVDDGVVLGGGVKTAVPETMSGDLVIPGVIDGMPVQAIGERAFYRCRRITSVVIPPSVMYIGCYAFFDCRGLMAVTIPEGVMSIAEDAFSSCLKLTTVKIPKSVMRIGSSAFACCYAMTSVTICGDRPNCPNGIFRSCKNLKAIHVSANAKGWTGMKEWQGIPLVFDVESK